MFEKLKSEYKASLKSSDTEEHIDLLFYRRLGFAWACLFRWMHVSPNAVTIASIFIGVAAGICMYPTNIWINIGGIILLIWANSFDSADGQLARLTGQFSRLGRILDGMAGDFWFISIYASICARTMVTVPFFERYPWAIWVLAMLAGFFHARQAAVADSFRQFHLYLVKRGKGGELDSSEELRKKTGGLSWKHNFWRKLIMLLYTGYTSRQESVAPVMQRVRQEIAQKYPDGKLPADIAREFRAWSLPLCKWENFMTFNWRSIALFICLLAGQPWVYFIIELTVFNVVLWYTIRRHNSICLRMEAVLTGRENI